MLNLDDDRWKTLTAGYRIPIDLRPLLANLEYKSDRASAWTDLWHTLYHQGDVGTGSFVAIPHIVRIYRKDARCDWNAYALVASIELARADGDNPDVPAWARQSYDDALRDLAQLALTELPQTPDPITTRAILGLLALVYGARTYGRVLVEFTEDEVLELERLALGDPS
jgi:hypothetical protein